jgi:malonyl-CoA O-methyltransferase
MSVNHSPAGGDPLPPLDPVAAQHVSAKMSRQGPPWLHNEVAKRMVDRLPLIRQPVKHWAHWEPQTGGLASQTFIESLYPQAQSTVIQPSASGHAWATQALKFPWWRRWLGPQRRFAMQVGEPADMLWSNMGLHLQAQPQRWMQQWASSLNDQGFVMFSCLGPDSLVELRQVHADMGWDAPHHAFTDMHDWGDMLLQAGFASPIMDMERITLTYVTSQELLCDLRSLGRNLSPQRFAGLRGRAWLSQLHQSLTHQLSCAAHEGRLALTFEVIYGHAFKARRRTPVKAQTEVSLQDMKAMLIKSAR